ncbi:MAG: hypothetical protein Q8O55_01430 [Dehalococcoidales bacterium]|nr:hypothetical protein [Dehalococcoidales bacterium]
MGIRQEIADILSRQRKVVRRAGVTLDLTPASAGNGANLFNILGGPVLVYALFGECTVNIGGGAAVPRLQFLSAAATLSGLCVAATTIAAVVAGTLLTWTGLLAGLLTPAVGLAHLDLTGAEAGFNSPLTFGIGSVRLTNAVSAVSGIIDWYLAYEPCTPQSLVTPG